jgi:hypothetical protein
MMLCISARFGTSVVYLRLMFCTPRPTLETSREPSLRRPGKAAASRGRAVGFAAAALAAVVKMEGSIAPAASTKPDFSKSRRFKPPAGLSLIDFSMLFCELRDWVRGRELPYPFGGFHIHIIHKGFKSA